LWPYRFILIIIYELQKYAEVSTILFYFPRIVIRVVRLHTPLLFNMLLLLLL
jgi:hypothetical protein